MVDIFLAKTGFILQKMELSKKILLLFLGQKNQKHFPI